MTNSELDALVHKEVMHLEPTKIAVATKDGKNAAVYEDKNGPLFHHNQVRDWIEANPPYRLAYWLSYPHYSTDIKDAWEIVEHCQKLRPTSLVFTICGSPGGNYCCVVTKTIFRSSYDEWMRQELPETIADTAPKAIVLASLKAVGVEVK